ncbi:MAG: SGNH/GDSL hydrolase family protein [Ferrovibrio sp.]
MKRFSMRFIGLLVAGFLLATLAVELTLRLTAATPLWRVLPVVEVSLYGPDPRTGYSHRPGASGIWRTENRAEVTINYQGFRGAELPEPKSAGELRIAVVGDSMVEALQVDAAQMLTAVLERQLKAAGRDVRVANFGLAGATPAVQRERVATHVVARQPDVVVLMPNLDAFFGPKAADDSAFPAWVPTADGEVALRHAFRDSAGYRFRNSTMGQLYYTLLDQLQIAGLLNNRKNAGFLPPSHAAPASVAPVDPCLAMAAYWRRLEDPVGWRRVAAYLNDMAVLGHEHGFRPVVALRSVAANPSCSAVVQSLRDAAWRQIAAQAAAAQIPLHDMDTLVAAHLAPDESVSRLHGFHHRLGRGHLNPRGHEVYAAVLTGILQP